MMDNEFERVEAGWLMDDRRSSKINHDQSDLDGKIIESNLKIFDTYVVGKFCSKALT